MEFPMKVILITLGFAGLCYAFYKVYSRWHLEKNMDEILSSGAVILDVRTAREFAKGHLPGAIHISLGTIREADIPFAKNQPVVTYCSHGLRSIKAASILKARGFMQVHNGGAMNDLAQRLPPSQR
ncbi:phage shock protein E [Siphonobacter sp. SORGH_AS 1065]|nr:phage shock protein E [Siphonobacter sp. SORGH_AS_1065]